MSERQPTPNPEEEPKMPQIETIPEEIGRADILRFREKYLQPLEGEIEKTPEEVRFIAKANEWIEQELKELQIDTLPTEIKPEQVHILSDVGWETEAGWGNHDDAYNKPYGNAIIIHSERVQGQLKRMAIILHESIHLQSHHKFRTNEDPSYRDGYMAENQSHETSFEGFNEAVVEGLTMHLMYNHEKELEDEFKIDLENLDDNLFNYRNYVDLLSLIIADVAKKKGESTDVVRDKILRGLFSGETTHLQDIEGTYGKSALQVINYLGVEGKSQKVFNFFSEKDDDKRNIIAEEILKETQ